MCFPHTSAHLSLSLPVISHLSPSSSRRCDARRVSLPLTSSPSPFLSLSATSEVRECSREGQRSLRGFSEIWRLKPPVGLVTTQFAGVPMVYKKKKKKKTSNRPILGYVPGEVAGWSPRGSIRGNGYRGSSYP